MDNAPESAAGAAEAPVELFGLGPDADMWRAAQLYNAVRDEYAVPEPPPEARPLMLQMYLASPGATVEKFDAAWPQIWKLTETVYRPTDNLLAILDTGYMQKHPMLAGCVRDSMDFTGEGIEDTAGHGTLAALIARMAMTGFPQNKFVIIKCVGMNSRGTEEALIDGLRWMQTYNATHAVKIAVASLSLGAYNKRFGVFPCEGTCRLCTTALEVSQEIRLHVAAGNTPGRTACPARAAFLPNGSGIIAESRSDETTSGSGTHTGSLYNGGPARFMTLARS
jgi:hypothetical protein